MKENQTMQPGSVDTAKSTKAFITTKTNSQVDFKPVEIDGVINPAIFVLQEIELELINERIKEVKEQLEGIKKESK